MPSYMLISDSLVRGRALSNFLRGHGIAVTHIVRPEDQFPADNFDTAIVQFNHSTPEKSLEELLSNELELVNHKLAPTIPILVTLPSILMNNTDLTILLANKCIQFGASDYQVLVNINGRLSEEILVRLRICTEKARLSKKNESLRQATKALEYGSIVAICALAECRDRETGQHILRVSRVAKILADNLPGFFDEEISPWPDFAGLIEQAAPLHDIGKVAITDNILLNRKKLGKIQFKKMQTHTTLGADFLSSSHNYLQTPIMEMGALIARSHHERFDGNGYPHQLQGRGIPLPARIVAIADVYDSVRSKRCYRPCSLPHEQVARIIKMGRNKNFDPDLVDVFCKVEDSIFELYKNDDSNFCIYSQPLKDCYQCPHYAIR